MNLVALSPLPMVVEDEPSDYFRVLEYLVPGIAVANEPCVHSVWVWHYTNLLRVEHARRECVADHL